MVPTRIVVSPEIRGREEIQALPFSRFLADEGEVVARSRSSDTRAVVLAGHALHLKRYRYSVRQTIRGMFRNTRFGLSRVAREYAMLVRVAERLGPGVVPRAVAYGERRRVGFLRAAFLATETVPDAQPVADDVDAGDLGRFLRRIHDGGFTHGRLYARNLLVTGEGSFRIVDLDRASLTEETAHPGPAALDLACLLASLPGIGAEQLFAAYGRERARYAVIAMMPMARAGLDRRSGPPRV